MHGTDAERREDDAQRVACIGVTIDEQNPHVLELGAQLQHYLVDTLLVWSAHGNYLTTLRVQEQATAGPIMRRGCPPVGILSWSALLRTFITPQPRRRQASFGSRNLLFFSELA